MPAYSKYETVPINGFVDMKEAYALKANPPSLLKIAKLPIRCMVKNDIKNNPVNDINSFLPSVLVSIFIIQLMLDLFYKLENCKLIEE